MLHLAQASVHGTAHKIRRLRSTGTELTQSEAPRQGLGEKDICAEALENALRSVRVVAGTLVQRSGAAKGSKTGREVDYKVVLDTFVHDLLAVLYQPEWPAAAIYVNVLSRLLVSVQSFSIHS